MNRFLIPLALSAIISSSTLAHSAPKKSAPIRSISWEIRVDKNRFAGSDVFATINGRRRQVVKGALQAWVVLDGRAVVYAGRDGAGGYENEGQSLRLFDATTGRTKKILSEFTRIDKVREAKLSNGKTAFLVELSDGGLGASYFAVVDPRRGQVFSRGGAILRRHQGDRITLDIYKGEDPWQNMQDNKKVKPDKTEHYDLKTLLKRAVIVNNSSRM